MVRLSHFPMRYKVEFELELLENPYEGLYIALEGIDGSGKTTQVEKIKEYFSSQNREVILTREPRKSGFIGDLIGKVLLGEVKLPSISLQYLFSADRAVHHEEVIVPALKKGAVVISDRCFWSAIVYGILDRTNGDYAQQNVNALLISQSILSMYHQFIVPDYTFLLKIPLEATLKRGTIEKAEKAIYEDKEKLEKVVRGYDYLSSRFKEHITVINGDQDQEKVTADMIGYISK